MSPDPALILKVSCGVAAGVLAALLLKAFLLWLLAGLIKAGQMAVHALNVALIAVMRAFGAASAEVGSLAYELAATLFVWVMYPPARWVSEHFGALRGSLKATRIAVQSGASAPEETDQTLAQAPRAEPVRATDPYLAALAVMGIEDGADLSLPILSQRYRQMMAIVHPDKGFPNAVFAKEIDAAMAAIKERRGWARST